VKKLIFGFIIFTFFAPVGVCVAFGEGGSGESGAYFDTFFGTFVEGAVISDWAEEWQRQLTRDIQQMDTCPRILLERIWDTTDIPSGPFVSLMLYGTMLYGTRNAIYHRRKMMHNLARSGDNPSDMKYCLENGWDIDARNDDGDTPLHIAARFGNKKVVLYLLWAKDERGNKQNFENNASQTALDCARLNGREECERLLAAVFEEGIGINFIAAYEIEQMCAELDWNERARERLGLTAYHPRCWSPF